MATVYERPVGRRLMVRGLRPGLPERGKIKIGMKGEARPTKSGGTFQLPQKLDHFIVTSMTRGEDGNFVRDEEIHKIIGDKPTRIPIRLLFDEIDLNLQTRFAAFDGRTVWCQGDGETAVRRDTTGKMVERACPCRNLEQDYKPAAEKLGPACKINGRLSVIIDLPDAPLGGIWAFRTTSWNTCSGLASALTFLQSVAGGRLAGVPLVLTLQPRAATDPDGKAQTIYVVGMEFAGGFDALRERAYTEALADAKHSERLQLVHDTARSILSVPLVGGDDDEDVAAEFYPDQAAREVVAAAIAGRPIGQTGFGRTRFVEPDPAAEPGELVNQDTGEVTAAKAASGAEPAAEATSPKRTMTKAQLEAMMDAFMACEDAAGYFKLSEQHDPVLSGLKAANGAAWRKVDGTLKAVRVRLGIEVEDQLL